MARARKAQAGVGACSPSRSARERVLRFRDAIVERADEIVDLLARECGKPRHEALVHEVMVVADLATYYCRARRAHPRPARDPAAPHEAPEERRPLRPARRRGRHLAVELPLPSRWAT